MPTPARTSLGEIVVAGRAIVETDGLEGLTMQKVAAAVGVRSPSLYKHVASRGLLVKLIVEDVVRDLGRTLDAVFTGDDPNNDMLTLARAFRDFAHRQPETYRLVFAPVPDEWRPAPEVLASASGAVLKTAAALAGPERALEAARLITAWAHGFLTMELAGAFRLGGDIDEAFTYGVKRLTDAVTRS